MGFIIALKNIIDTKIKQRQPTVEKQTIERVRVNFDS